MSESRCDVCGTHKADATPRFAPQREHGMVNKEPDHVVWTCRCGNQWKTETGYFANGMPVRG